MIERVLVRLAFWDIPLLLWVRGRWERIKEKARGRAGR